MADPVKAARDLKGLNSRERKPWDEPMSAAPAPPKASPAPPPPPKPRSTGDDAEDRYNKLAKRNRDIANRTRHLRQN